MKVTIKYFASLRESLCIGQETLEIDAAQTCVADVRQLLSNRGGAFAEHLAPGQSLRVAVNLDVAHDQTAVSDGAELAFFPPVTGG